ncbi:MAG: response regulator [Synechococcales cyanobacterium T60_A2020_003]|nr:response regulator [Synechococcales cyanobacterium T60_A2020_003]
MQDCSTQRLVLVWQSDSAYRSLIQKVLAEHDAHPNVVVIDYMQDASDFLQCQGNYTARPRPDLILLDLELAGESPDSEAFTGYDLLSMLKTDSRLKRIPIIVLTMSDSPEDIVKTYTVQGNCYVIRPGDRDQLVQTIQRIEDFWLNIVTLPSE